MPLSKQDPALDYNGSWGDASEGWPSIIFDTEQEAKRAYVEAWRNVKVPYGSYVLVGHVLRLETEEWKERVERHLRTLGPEEKRAEPRSFGPPTEKDYIPLW